MSTGIRKLHSKGCPGQDGGRCRRGAGWEASVYFAREGRKVRKTFPRKAEAESWRDDAKVAANRGALRPNSDTRRLADALTDHVEGMRRGMVRPKGRAAYKPNTVRSYERAVAVIASTFGALRVTDVRRRDVQALVDELLAESAAPASVANILNPLQAFYRRAIDRDEIAHNPTERIDLPAGGLARPTRIAAAAEAAELIDALAEEDRALWATAFYAGLRRGELQALRWCDVDLGASTIAVERSWDQYEGPLDPKSRASRRRVPLLAVLRDYLDEHKLATGRDSEDLVFGRSAAEPFAPITIGKRSRRAWKKANLEPITLHECRHTFASLLIDSGANPKAIQTYMGHSKIQTTFDTYGHLMPGSHDEVRARMDAYLGTSSQDSGDRSPN